MPSKRPLSPIVLGVLVGAALVAGCSAAASSTPSASSAATATPAAGLRIVYEENAQVELIATSGRRILIDVWDRSSLTAPPTANDILLTTHGHPDHYDSTFVDSFPGQKLTFEEGQINLPDVSIVGIASAHDEGQALAPQGGSNYIYVISVDGLRIGHFGDLGQDKLSDDQLARIGKLDIAFSQLSNSFSSMDERNKKGINLMNQVKPLIFVPTHMSLETARLAAAAWNATYSAKPIAVTPATLPAQTTVVFMGNQAESMAAILNLSPSPW